MTMDGDWRCQADAGDEGFADGDSPDDEAVPMDTGAGSADTDDELLNGPRASVYYQVSQTCGMSKEEVEEMMKSEAYQKKIDTCHLCSACWYTKNCRQDCPECEGFAMSRPCPECNGRCGQVWNRNVKKSHSYHKAYWDGTCKLSTEPTKEKRSRSSAKSLTKGMKNLSTS